MKKLYATLLTLTICTTVFAQAYAPMLDSVNEWWYAGQFLGVRLIPQTQNAPCTYPVSAQGSDFREYTGADTLIGLNLYKQVYHTTWNCLLGFVREDTAARKVYFLDDTSSTERLLYDFSMQPGDTMTLQFNPGYYTSGVYTLDSIRIVNIHAGPRRAFYLSNHATSWAPKMTWIESVGCPTEMFYPYFDNFSMSAIFSSCPGEQHTFSQFLSCFYHDSKIYDDNCAYQVAVAASGNGATVIDSCDYYYFTGGIHDLQAGLSFGLQPNPAIGQTLLQIESLESQDAELTVYDLTGREMLNGEKMHVVKGSNSITLDVSVLPPGSYLVSLRTAKGVAVRPLMVGK